VDDEAKPTALPMSLTVGAGEIVGVAGAEGNGQRGLLRGIIGIGKSGGTIAVDLSLKGTVRICGLARYPNGRTKTYSSSVNVLFESGRWWFMGNDPPH